MSKKGTKATFHPRNKYQGHYNWETLSSAHPPLGDFVHTNKYGNETIDFSSNGAVVALNTALLKHHYKLSSFHLPNNHLCPAVPGRADYVHHLADLLSKSNDKKPVKGKEINILDIGTGASLIYPIIGSQEYSWSYVGTDAYEPSLSHAKIIKAENKLLLNNIELREQPNPAKIFDSIVGENEYFDAVMCNPPFYSSQKEADAVHYRKKVGLKQKHLKTKNFGGEGTELIFEAGGEVGFVSTMIRESSTIPYSCYWYTSLISKKEHLDPLLGLLKQMEATEVEVINIAHGNKMSRIIAWTYLSRKQQTAWRQRRWS